MSATASSSKPVLFKKGPRSRPNASRKRSASPPTEDSPVSEEASSAVVRPTRKAMLNPLVQGSKRRRGPDESGGGLDEFDYKADEGLLSRGDEFATRDSNWDLESADKPRDDSSKRVRLNEDGEIAVDDGMYRGQAGYLPTINKRKDSVMDSKMTTGPIRATANIRTITLMDYQPDICKPYKETGFCGYGDSCKFMHDRGDYLAGWQLDKLAEDGEPLPEEEEEEEMLPFACLICKKEFDQPIVTKCGHYFCMQCAIDRFIKSPKCYACGAATNGIFNKAEKLLAKLEAKRKRRLEERGIVEDDDGGIEIGGGDDSDGDDDAEGHGGSDGGRARSPSDGWHSASDQDDD